MRESFYEKRLQVSSNMIYFRPNMTIKSKVLVTRVIFDGVRAVGVEFVDSKGETKREFAEKEIILSGGAINSPQLLLLSGVGDADHLKSLDIPIG
jgi:choline dehydrogenase